MNVQKISLGYSPRPLQAELHKTLKRFNVIVAHRRFGKSVFCIAHMIARGLENQNLNPRYAYIAPLYSQAKRVAWDYLKQYALKIPGSVANEAELRVDIPRPDRGDMIRFTLLGADNPNSIRGIYLDGVILDEYADMNPSMWGEIIRPALADRLGWAIFIGTPKGQNEFYKLYDRATHGVKNEATGDYIKDTSWFSAMFKASETGVVAQSELDAAKAEMTEDEYEQEFECSFNAQLVGAYFKKELALAEKEGRITRVPHDPMLPVDLYFDLGINDMAAVWFVQSFRKRHRLIDYYEATGASIPEFVAEIRKRPYNLGDWVFPHDAQARDFSTGKSQLQVFYYLGARRSRVIPRVGTKRESINAARMIFGACEFDQEKCKRGLECLQNYQRKFDSKNNVFAEAPLHNWASNGADAFQQFAMGARDDSRDTAQSSLSNRRGEMVAETDFNPYARSLS
jgi:phage terminase large subunit